MEKVDLGFEFARRLRSFAAGLSHLNSWFKLAFAFPFQVNPASSPERDGK